jgi:hypothetical protein
LTGTVVAGWEAVEGDEPLLTEGTSEVVQYFLQRTLVWLFYGFVVVLLAELVDRMSFRSSVEDTTDERPDA